MNDIAPTQATPTSGGTITQDVFASWLQFVDAKPQTRRTYTRAIRQFISYLNAHGITQPTRADVINYRDDMMHQHQAATVALYLTAVKAFFAWTDTSGIYPNIAARIKRPHISTAPKKDYLTSSQGAGILASINRDDIQGLRDYALLRLMLTCGLRTIEATRANVGDIRTHGDIVVLYVEGKGRDDKQEFVKLPPRVDAAIRAYLKERGRLPATAPLFASLSNQNAGERMTTRSISRIIKARLIDAGYNSDRLTAHSLRHSAAVIALNNGASLQDVSIALRHSSTSITRIYTHSIERDKADTENIIEDALNV